jgi:hypothetical protein
VTTNVFRIVGTEEPGHRVVIEAWDRRRRRGRALFPTHLPIHLRARSFPIVYFFGGSFKNFEETTMGIMTELFIASRQDAASYAEREGKGFERIELGGLTS